MRIEDIQQILQSYADAVGKVCPEEVTPTLNSHFTEYETELRFVVRSFAERQTNCLADRIFINHLIGNPNEYDYTYSQFEFEAFLTLAGQPEGLETGELVDLFDSTESLENFIGQLRHNMCHVVNQDNCGSLQIAIKEAVEEEDRRLLLEEERYYCCLQEDEEECIMVCGCRMIRNGDAIFLIQCEAHEAVNEIAKKLNQPAYQLLEVGKK